MSVLEPESTVAGSSSSRPRRSAGRLALIVIAVSGVLAFLGRSAAIETRQDDAAYVLLGEALLDGHYNESWRVDAPPHSKYPPVYPAVLAAIATVFGPSHEARIALGIVALMATLGLVYVGMRHAFGDGIALAGLVAVAFNGDLIRYAGEAASEPAYTVLSLGALALVAVPGRWRREVAAVTALAVTATLSRTIGIALLGAILVHWGLERRWRAAAVLAVASAATVGAWLVWTVAAPVEPGAANYVAELTARSTSNSGVGALRRTVTIGTAYAQTYAPWTMGFPTIEGTPIDNLIVLVTWVSGLTVGLAVLWRKWRAAALYVLFYWAILLQWWGTERLLVPLLPIMVPAIVGGVWVIGRRIRPVVGVAAAGLLALALAVNGLVRSVDLIATRCDRVEGLPTGACLSADQESYFQALRYVRSELPEDAIVASAKPEPLYLYTRRRTAPARAVIQAGPAEFGSQLDRYEVGYVLGGSLQNAERALPERLVEVCTRLTVEAEFAPRTWLFRVWPTERPAGSNACGAAERYREANADLTFSLQRRRQQRVEE